MNKLLKIIVLGTITLLLPASGFAKHIVREGEPIITLKKINAPEKIKQGGSCWISAEITISKNLWEKERAFLHILDPKTKNVLVNADFDPQPPTTKWVPGQIIILGPAGLFFPPDLEPGEYPICMGLFGAKEEPTGSVYVREPYTNKEIADFIVGTIRVEKAAEEQKGKLPDLVISDFSTLVDQRKWELEEADLEATPKEEGPGYGGKITFKASSTISAVRLESFFRYCKPEFKHWEAYDNLIMEIYSPPDQQGSTALRTPLTLQVKDGAGRRFKMPISPTAEKGKPVTINVFKIGEEINVADVNQIVLFTPTSLVADQTVFLNYIKLVSSGVTETTGPFVIFKGLQVEQNKIKPGESVVFTATFSITNPFRSNYNLYIHIYRAKDSAGWISINKDPRIPTNQWPVNQDVVEGPFSVPIPPNASAGIYNIEMGLFIPITLSSPKAKYLKYRRGKNGIYYVSEPTFPVDYIKQPYVNYEEYGDWVVGTFEVLPPE